MVMVRLLSIQDDTIRLVLVMVPVFSELVTRLQFRSAFVNWNTAAITAAGISVWAVSRSLQYSSIPTCYTATKYGIKYIDKY